MATMKKLLLTFCLLWFFSFSQQDEFESNREKRAIGGQTFQRGRWPWLVLLKATIYTDRFLGLFPTRHYHLYCGGALISNEWLLTAAHCFGDSSGSPARRHWNWEARMAAVRLRPSVGQRLLDLMGRALGQSDWRQWEVDVSRIVIHPDYNSTSFLSDDIALVKLSQRVPTDDERFSFIRSIRLPHSRQDDDADEPFPSPRQACITKGWGCTSSGGAPSSRALQLEMPVQHSWVCGFHYRLYSGMARRICAGRTNGGIGVCSGDSGSPLVCPQGNNENTLAGIVSFSSRDNPGRYPAVFTRVQDYLPWIDSVLNGNY